MQTDGESPLAKRRLKDFETLESLGKGEFGEVVKVRDRETKELFAMKIFPKEKVIKDSQRLALFKTEVSILRKIIHPNIVHCFDKIEDPTNYYVVLTYCSGGDLESYIKTQGTIEEHKAYSYLNQLVDAFFELHKSGIMHRDLKPANILLEDNCNRVLLADFGLAKSGVEFATSTLGTPIYTAPEVFLSENQYDNMADLWSLGVVFYRMIYGVEPWSVRSWSELTRKIQTMSGANLPIPPEPRTAEKIPMRNSKVDPQTDDLLRLMICPAVNQRITWDALKHRVAKHLLLSGKSAVNNPYLNGAPAETKSEPPTPNPQNALVSQAAWGSVPAKFEGFKFSSLDPKDEYFDEFEDAFDNPVSAGISHQIIIPVSAVSLQPPKGYVKHVFERNTVAISQLYQLGKRVLDAVAPCLGDCTTLWCSFAETSVRIQLIAHTHGNGMCKGYSLDTEPNKEAMIREIRRVTEECRVSLESARETLQDIKATIGDKSGITGGLYDGLNASLEGAYFALAGELLPQTQKLPQELTNKLKGVLAQTELVNKWAANLWSLEKHTETNSWCNVYNSLQVFENLDCKKGSVSEVESKLAELQKMFA